MPTSDNDKLTKGKMYAVVDGEYREVMEFQGEITLSEADEKAWQYDYVRVVRCKDCRYRLPEGYCDLYLDRMQDNDYCSHGERRTNEAH